MPRQPRLDIPGLIHHVMARGIEGRDIFRLNKERDEFLVHLAEMASEKGGRDALISLKKGLLRELRPYFYPQILRTNPNWK